MQAYYRYYFSTLFLLIGTLCGMGSPAYGQVGAIEGRVTSTATGEAIRDANITLRGQDLQRGTSADGEGQYLLEAVPPGTYRLTASVIGFSRASRTVEVEAGQTLRADLQLAPRRYGLEEVVVSATREEERLSAVPSSVTVLGPEELEVQSALTGDLGAMLAQDVPGLAPSTGTLSNYGQTLRGRNLFVLVDGVPQSTPLRNGLRDLRTINSSAIERVEIIRGASALYGYGATGGAINVITKRPEAGVLNLTTEVGSRFYPTEVDNSFTGRLVQQASGRTGRFDYVFSGSYESWGYFYDGEGDLIPQDPQGQGGLAGADEYNVLARGGVQLTDNQRLELAANHYRFAQDMAYQTVAGSVDEEKATPEEMENVLGEDPGTFNTIVNLHYSRENLWGSDVSARAFLQDYKTRFGFASYFPDGGGQSFVRSEKLGARLDVETPLGILPFTTLRWGVDVLRDETAQPLEDGRIYVPPMTQLSAAPFAHVKLPLGEVALLRGGARYETIGLEVDDFTTLFGGNEVEGGSLHYDALAFTAGAILYVTDYAELFASFNQGFSVTEVGRELRSTQAASVDSLNPAAQKVNSYEVGVRGGTGILRASLAAFINTSELGTTFGDFPELEIIRTPERIRGVEATLDLQPTDQIGAGGTLTYLEGKRDTDEDDAYETFLPGPRIPPLKLTGYLSYAPTASWRNRLQVLHSGDRSRFDGSTAFGEGDVDSFTRVDLLSSFDVGPGTLKLGVQNVLDNFYFPPVSQWYNLGTGYSAAPGRSVNLSYRVRW